MVLHWLCGDPSLGPHYRSSSPAIDQNVDIIEGMSINDDSSTTYEGVSKVELNFIISTKNEYDNKTLNGVLGSDIGLGNMDNSFVLNELDSHNKINVDCSTYVLPLPSSNSDIM